MRIRRLAGAAAVAAIAGASVLYASTAANAASTVPAQLSLTGVTTASSPLGGTTVGLHPGDTLQLSASTAPTAGLASLGLPVGGLVNSVAGYEVIAHFPVGFPGGARNVTLGYKASTLINFPTAGTYPFTWNAYRLSSTILGGVVATPINLTSAQIQQAHIGINAQGQWVGQVVVSNNPPAGGLGVQLPNTSISPSLPVGGLPSVHLPGLTTPTLPGVPKLPGLPGIPGAGKGPAPKPGSGGTQLNYQPPGANPADQVVPKGYGSGSGASYQYVAPGLGSTGGSSVAGSNGTSGGGSGGSSAANAANGKAAGSSSGAVPSRSRAVDLASSSDHGIAALPSLLVIAAVFALSGATALYARTFLLHPRAARVPVRR